MNKINWCKKQSKGIQLIDPNENLCKEYFDNAEESLRVLRVLFPTKSKMWLAVTKYYIEYFAVYSVLMKIGIKCEIHDCTIFLIKFLENESIFDKGISITLENDKELRIDNQYYLKERPVIIDFGSLSVFLLSIKKSLSRLDSNKITEIRNKITAF